ncbi:phosphate ABC transporter ATP-binding protein [Sutcliffiella cohnii]|uniref:Phosphate ABC transporter ATP-binding protein n=1 Tax=Sutcliffiella cohnii TaxID=33932 RepID=A0A223KKE8_9BACI|nr:phosphate ABC transporter ATP-binding protein [Sutcliffiella cohnii]AST89932.1 phosphate ABC transporter ATP-binding protein [Sutcliffiella cohnii]
MSGAIQFHDVHYKSEDGIHILRGITGSIIEGEVTTLVGPSGAGKSTLLKLCNGLLSPTSGEIRILNKNVYDYDPVQLRKEVGMALQSAPMVEGDVFHNLALPMLLQGKSLPENEAVKLLEDVGLEGEHLRRNIKDLSGGQRQKVSIARTLVNRPKILLLDEITSSLDQVSQKEIDELIVKISKKYGVTIIWITHNLQQALKVGTYAWMLKEGELLESGKSDLLHTSTNEHVQAFVKGEIE